MRAILLFITLSLLVFGYVASPDKKPVTWIKSGKLVSPFEYYGQKVLLSEQEGVERENPYPKIVESFLDLVGWNRNYSIKKGTQLSFILKPHCLKEEKVREEVGLNFELLNRNLKANSNRPLPSVVVTVSANTSSKDLARQVAHQDCIIGVGNRRKLYSTARKGKDPLLGKQSYLKAATGNGVLQRLVKFEEALKRKLVVAVIDSGADLKHPDLAPNLWVNSSELNGKANFDDDGNGYKDDVFGFDFSSKTGDPSHKANHDHGSHVAGLIAAAGNNDFGIRGVLSEKVSIMNLNVTGRYRGAMPEEIEEAIYYAVENGADVINISMGSPGRADTIAHAITYAVNEGVFVVGSVGNESLSLDKTFYIPGSYAVYIPGMISVGAFDVNTGEKCDISNYSNKWVEIMAPGCNALNPQGGLLSLAKESGFKYRKGTSMAAPIVGGGIALMKAYYSDILGQSLSPMELESMFLENAEQSPKLKAFVKEGRVFRLENIFGLQ